MTVPRISIVVPSFNQGRYLEATLLSILNQQYPNLELFVVDGGSPDNSVDIIKKYAGQINWWVSEKDSGQSEAINKGFKRATGDIISWLCSDDLYMPGTLAAVADHFSKLPGDVGLIHGGTVLFNDKKVIKTDWGYQPPLPERYFAGMAFSQPSAFFKRKHLEQAGGSLREELHYGMDYDLYCRLAGICRFMPVENIFSRYRLHEKSKSIASQYHFITDWNKVFINFCKNMGWEDEIADMKSTGLFAEDIFSFYYPYSYQPTKEIVSSLEKNKILFFQYCYTLKAWYRSDDLEKAKQLAGWICSRYPAHWWKTEPGVPGIIKRLRWPAAWIRTFRKIKK